MKFSGTKFSTLLIVCLVIAPASYADFEVLLPIENTSGGSYVVEAGFGESNAAKFLIDTGAGMSTVSPTMFKTLKKNHVVVEVRKVAARLANGKMQVAKVYQIKNFRIGNQCNIGAVEVAVLPNSNRNIIGMDILAKTAPFGLNLDQPALMVSKCELINSPPRFDLTLSK